MSCVDEHDRRMESMIDPREKRKAELADFQMACWERRDASVARFGPLVEQRLKETVQHLIDIENAQFTPPRPQKRGLFGRKAGRIVLASLSRLL